MSLTLPSRVDRHQDRASRWSVWPRRLLDPYLRFTPDVVVIFRTSYDKEKEKKVCSFYRGKSLKPNDKFREINGVNELFQNRVERPIIENQNVSAAVCMIENRYKTWHNKIGNYSTNRYTQLFMMREDVPKFSRKVMESFQCIPFYKRGCARHLYKKQTPYSRRVTLRTLGPMEPSPSGNIYAVHLLEPCTARSEVSLVKEKSAVVTVLHGYVAHVEHRFSREGCGVQVFPCDNTSSSSWNISASREVFSLILRLPTHQRVTVYLSVSFKSIVSARAFSCLLHNFLNHYGARRFAIPTATHSHALH